MPPLSSPFARHWRLDAPIVAFAGNRRGREACALLADGRAVILPTDDAGEDPFVILAHDSRPLCLAPDADDHAFLSGGADGRVLLIEPGIGAATPLVEAPGQGPISAIASAPAGRRAYAQGGCVHWLDETGQDAVPPLENMGELTALAFAQDGGAMELRCAERLLLWHPPAPPEERPPPPQTPPVILSGRAAAQCAAHPCAPLWAAGFSDGSFFLVPEDGRGEILLLPPGGGGAAGLVFEAQGQGLLAARANGELFLFTPRSLSRVIRK